MLSQCMSGQLKSTPVMRFFVIGRERTEVNKLLVSSSELCGGTKMQQISTFGSESSSTVKSSDLAHFKWSLGVMCSLIPIRTPPPLKCPSLLYKI